MIYTDLNIDSTFNISNKNAFQQDAYRQQQ